MKLVRYYYRIENYIKLRLKNVKLRGGVNSIAVYEKTMIRIHKSAKVKIGTNFSFVNNGEYNPLCPGVEGSIFAEPNSELVIGDNVGMSSCHIWCANRIIIGSNVKIGADSIIMDNDCHSLDYVKRRKPESDQCDIISAPITIDDDVLVGARSIIMKGVKIGKGSIIGIGSVVTKDVPPHSVAAGNPCRIIKMMNYGNDV